jgi:hypothetical protein
VRTIELDATKWKTALDFYDALLTGIGAPEWHGKSPDALIDSMIWGGINAVEPPYTVRISGLSAAPQELCAYVQLVSDVLVDGRTYRKRHKGDDIDVSIVVAPTNDGIDQAAKIRNAVAAVQYEGPDPNIGSIADKLRRKFKLGPSSVR